MSTPLSSLNKNRRLPIRKSPTNDETPNEATTRPNVFRYSNEEAALINEVTNRMVAENIKTTRTRAPTDLDLLQLSMNRMQTAEAEVRFLTSELKSKTQRVNVLEEKVKLYEKALQNSRDESYKVSVLEEKCRRLQSIIDRMEDLLIERGLEVIGELDEPDHLNILTFDEADQIEQKQLITNSPTTTWRPDESVPNVETIDFNRMIERIRELNILVGESEMRVEKSNPENRGKISTLKRLEPIQLTIYANGIFLFNGPFRSFSENSTQRFVRDILDGYFPTELQQRFPDGVPFDISDKREIEYVEQKRPTAFQGQGHVLWDGRTVDNQTETTALPRISNSSEKRPTIPLNKFLNRLPRSVVKNGQVIDIREDIERQLTNQQEASARCESAISEIKFDADNSTPITTLRIRSNDGQQSYVIKMKTNSTIDEVKQILIKKKKIHFDFDLVAMGSNQTFTDGNQTLEQCSLVPNATLGIREKKVRQ